MSLFANQGRELKLYPHQEDVLEKIRSEFRRGNKRVIMCMSTGSGKSETSAQMQSLTATKANLATMFVVHMRGLVEQYSQRLSKYCNLSCAGKATYTNGTDNGFNKSVLAVKNGERKLLNRESRRAVDKPKVEKAPKVRVDKVVKPKVSRDAQVNKVLQFIAKTGKTMSDFKPPQQYESTPVKPVGVPCPTHNCCDKINAYGVCPTCATHQRCHTIRWLRPLKR